MKHDDNSRAFTERYKQICEELFGGYKNSISEPVGVVLSGGIDSSLIAHYVSSFFPNAVLFTLVTEKSHDKPFAELMAKKLGNEHVLVDIDGNKLREVKNEVASLLKEAGVEQSLMQVSLASIFYFLCKAARENGITHLFTGQGPDILFAGYNKYKPLEGQKELRSEIMKDLPLLEIDGKRDNAMAEHFGVTLYNPYLEKAFMDFSYEVPLELLIHNGEEKYISRLVAADLGLPRGIVHRPKKAMQYSTGVQNLMKKIG